MAAKKHSPQFKKWNDRFYRGGVRRDQLQRLVALEVLTKEEYKEITGDDFPEVGQ